MRKLALLVPLVLFVCASAQAAGPIPFAPPSAPTNLHGFLLRADEPVLHTFPRTPAFSWNAVRKAVRYEFELSTNQNFTEAGVVWSDEKLPQPAVSVPLQLPWMTGQPFALWAHVRSVAKNGKASQWSAPFGFNMRWRDTDVPQQITAPPGMVRWAPVEGATAYDVLYPDVLPATAFQTTTNVADEREFYTFHDTNAWTYPIRWRVRAVRYIDPAITTRNGLPRVSYGPWSPTFTSVNPPTSLGLLTPNLTVSDEYDAAGGQAKPHELTPGFAWSGKPTNVPGVTAGSPLYRVYVFTDDHCVNRVFTGSIVGSPAFAPRTKGGPLTLPQNTSDLGMWQSGFIQSGGGEGAVYSAEGSKAQTNEDPANAVDKDSGGTGAGVARVDLWDSGWPTGRYYWTVVPVEVLALGVPKIGQPQPVEYHEMNVPQDACETGRVGSFGKVSKPVVAQSSTPYVSGVSPTGRMISAVTGLPTFHSTPLIAWQPATGAITYDVEWSSKLYPWKKAGTVQTHATSAVLPIAKPGTWWYRVRGINPSLPTGAQNMTWSTPVALKLTGNQFKVVK